MPTETSNQSSERLPTKLQRRRTSIENLKMEETHANEETNTHWSTRVKRPYGAKRHSSSLSLDLKDSIIDFKDQDGHYTSKCDHSVLEDDHKCFCKTKTVEVQR